MITIIDPGVSFDEDELNVKFDGRWVAVIYNDKMFQEGEYVAVATGEDNEEDWNKLSDYVKTRRTKDMSFGSTRFADTNKDEGDLYVVFSDIE